MKSSRGGASHPFIELTLARLRELIREPEALFWAFVFPVVMSVAMAVAFPSSGGRPVSVGVLTGPAAEAAMRALALAPGVGARNGRRGGRAARPARR